MKASVLEAPQTSAIKELPEPKPGAEEIVVQVKACGTCSSEFSTWAGANQDAAYPLILGHEPSGVVVGVGHRVSGLGVGQGVAVLPTGSGRTADCVGGGFAEQIVVHETRVTATPRGVDYADAIVEPIGCLISGLERTGLRLAARVAVVGCGFMGLALIQLLRLRGPGQIVAVDTRHEALENALRFGADNAWHVDDIRAGHFSDQGNRGDGGYDLVCETSGTQPGLDLATAMTRTHGQLSIVGFHADGLRTVDVGLWNLKALTVINAHEKRYDYLLECMGIGLDLIASGQLDMRSLVTHRYGLDEVDQAYADMRDKPRGYIKGVVIP